MIESVTQVARTVRRSASDQAISQWRDVVGSSHVISDPAAIRARTHCTSGSRSYVVSIVRPENATQVTRIVQIANAHRTPLYPISVGNNWGYGAANPPRDHCAILDLSRLNRIVEFDAELGVVKLEPGVTQGQLHQFLQDGEHPFMTPVHGGGPTCSVLGNALDRGYGLTPHTDHFAAITSMKTVLPNGELLSGSLQDMNGKQVDGLLKWGIGPYLDGLFAQGNFGIVTQGTIRLCPRPESVGAFVFRVPSESCLSDTVNAIRQVMQTLPGIVSGVNLMNSLRVLAMICQRPSTAGPLSPSEVAMLEKTHGVSPWMGIGTIYGAGPIRRAAAGVIRRIFRQHGLRAAVFSQGKVRTLSSILGGLRTRHVMRWKKKVDSIGQFLNLASGQPGQIALQLPYWRDRGAIPKAGPIQPANDRRGLIWYSPLVPMKEGEVKRYVQHVRCTAPRFGFDPLITLTSIHDGLFDSTVPLLFEVDSELEVSRARECYQGLFQGGCEEGFVPYRVGIRQMDLVVSEQSTFWRTCRSIKRAIDPHGIIAPGRYSLD